MRKTPLKRKAPLGAGYDYEAFRDGIRFLDGLDCWLRRLLEERAEEHPHDWSPSILTCTGELDGHHLLRKNRLKQELPYGVIWQPEGWVTIDPGKAYPLDGPPEAQVYGVGVRTLSAILEDPRNGILGCRRHHDMLEAGQVVIQRDELPPRVFEFAEEYGLLAWLERYYRAD